MKSITLHLVVAGATYFNQLDRFQVGAARR